MINGVILDLDGTLYWGKSAVAGAPEFVARLAEQGVRTLFVTNRANRTPERIAEQLNGYGIACDRKDILTSAQATAQYVKRRTAFIIGEIGLEQALAEQGVTIAEDAPDYVIVSFDREFTYAKLKTACRLIGNGAAFIATNPDSGLRTEEGILPGTGAIVAAVAAGSRTQPFVIGKPETRIMDMALERLGMAKDQVIVIGDNLDTDIAAGEKAGIRAVLTLTGVSTRADLERSAHTPTWVVETYPELETIIERER